MFLPRIRKDAGRGAIPKESGNEPLESAFSLRTPVRLAVRTAGFHPTNVGSIPAPVSIKMAGSSSGQDSGLSSRKHKSESYTSQRTDNLFLPLIFKEADTIYIVSAFL